MAPEAASSSWPSFAEMASSVMPGGVGGGGDLREAEEAESYVGEEDIMDYQWNEDNIDIDFITGNERKGEGKGGEQRQKQKYHIGAHCKARVRVRPRCLDNSFAVGTRSIHVVASKERPTSRRPSECLTVLSASKVKSNTFLVPNNCCARLGYVSV